MSRQVFVKIPVEDKELDAVVSVPRQTSWHGCGVVLTHGAGGDLHHEHLEMLAKHLCQVGLLCLRFTMKTPNFKYRVKCFGAVLEFLRDSDEFIVNSCIIGGRSMGARVGAEVASSLGDHYKNFVIGLLCLSYPLHPPRKTGEQRISSIISVKVPTLFVSGTNDAMCRVDLMESALKRLTCDWSIHWVQGGDHGLLLKGKKNQSVEVTLQEACERILLWAQSVFMGERSRPENYSSDQVCLPDIVTITSMQFDLLSSGYSGFDPRLGLRNLRV